MLLYKRLLPISVFRSLDIKTNKCYDRTNRLHDTALLTRCYTQHALHPVTYFKINFIRVGKNSQKLTQLSPKSLLGHLVGKRTAQKHNQRNLQRQPGEQPFPRWSPAILTFNIYFYLNLYLYITIITINKDTPHLKPP